MVTQVRRAVKEGNYASVSEFFRNLIRTWQEDKVLNEINESRKEIKAGKGKVLTSLADIA